MAKEDRQFTKTDMERMGIFQEMGYITIKDNYKGNYASMWSALFSLIQFMCVILTL